MWVYLGCFLGSLGLFLEILLGLLLAFPGLLSFALGKGAQEVGMQGSAAISEKLVGDPNLDAAPFRCEACM